MNLINKVKNKLIRVATGVMNDNPKIVNDIRNVKSAVETLMGGTKDDKVDYYEDIYESPDDCPVDEIEHEDAIDEEPIIETKGELKCNYAIEKENGRIAVNLDWDDDMIDYLRRQGYEGSDVQVIQQMLVLMNKQALEEISEHESDSFK